MEIISPKEAASLGLKYYFTGKPCKHGHTAKRRVKSGECSECSRLARKSWGQSNPDKILKYRRDNKSRLLVLDKEYKKKNPEKTKAVAKKCREKNRSKYLIGQRLWASQNKEKRKQYSQSNLAVYAAHAAKRRAKMKNATPLWFEEDAIEKLYGLAQEMTVEMGEEYHVDHIVPLQSEIVCGLHCLANLQILRGCENISKGNRHWPDMPEPAIAA
jgi:Na+-translocating ferredoxin:NAD+ oxidoreductase RnfC subunit